MRHLTETELDALADRALQGSARVRAERHVSECATCREAIAARVAADRALKAALEHDPGDAYFERFASRVEERIRAAGGARDESTPDALRPSRDVAERGARGFMGWLTGPRLA